MNLNTSILSGASASAEEAGMHAADYIKDAGDSLRNAGNFEIMVTEGAHSGSQVIFQPNTISIGSGIGNDVVLFGGGISEKHLEIILPKGLMTKIRINPLQDAVILDDGARVEVGQYAEIDAETSVRFGDSEIFISRIADPRKFVKPGLRLMAFACVIMMVPLVYSLLSNFAIGMADASSRAISSLSSSVEQTSRQYLGTSIGLPASSQDVSEAFKWTVRTKLEDLKLNHRLRATNTSTGSIRVYGTISDRELPRWTSFLQWYDTKTDFPQLIRDVQRSDIEKDLPAIKSVWLDENPTVFFKDGTVGNVGAMIKSGWKIVDINNANVLIERDGATISLTY